MMLVALPFVVGVVVALSILRGFVLTYLWQWFVTPFGLPEISISHAIGISLIVAYLTYDGATAEKDGLEAVGLSLIGSMLVFIVGWVVHLVMVG